MIGHNLQMKRIPSYIILIVLAIAIMLPVIAHESTRAFSDRTVGLELHKRHNGNPNLGGRSPGGINDQKGLSGKWQLENTVKDIGDSIGMHISGDYIFDNNGTVRARYNVITDMSKPEADKSNVKSVYFDLLVDGTGKYSIADGTLHVNLDKREHSYKMGEGTYDNMGPEYKDKDLMGRIFVKLYFGALFSKLSNEFKDVNIKNVNIGGDKIEGSLMGTPVTLTRID